MAYAFVMSACFSCKTPFSYNPHRVPSIRVNGEREPICEACILAINPLRIEKGLEPFAVHPDAYKAIREEEL